MSRARWPIEDGICILNARAGSSRAAKQRRAIDKLFASHGKKIRVILARSGGAVVGHAKTAAARKTPLVIAAGGDGTVSAVACMIAGSQSTLGVLPLGTLNHFAKDLKVPLDLPKAVANLFAGRPTQVDVGEVNGQIFINNSSLGLYPGIVQLREAQERRGRGKWPSFARALLYALWRFSPLSVRLAADEVGEKVATTPFVFVGNNQYELAAPHEGERRSLNQGKLWVYLAPHAGRGKLILLALRALFGMRPAELDVIAAKEISIDARSRRMRVANDGEVINLTPPLRYRSIPGALRVIVPSPEAEPPA